MNLPITKSLALASKELLRGRFDNVVKAFSYPEVYTETLPLGTGTIISGGTYGPYSIDGDYDYTIDGNGFNYFKYVDVKSCQTALLQCPPLQAIINKKAQAYVNGKTWVLDKATSKEAQGKIPDNLRKLFRKPNPLQSWKHFEAQGYSYIQAFGYSIVFSVKPYGFKENTDATSLWNIPPTMVDIEETKKLFYQTDQKGILKEIVLNYKGERTVLSIDDIYIMKDFIPSFNSLIIPGSRIISLSSCINNIIGALESRGTLIHYRGIMGIFSQDSGNGQNPLAGGLPMTPLEKDELQKDLRRYGLKRNQIQFVITKASLRWQQVGVPVSQLMLFEEIEADTQMLCDGFGMPFRLMGAFRSNSLGGSDANEFNKILYQDSIIPEAESIYEQWNEFFNLDQYGLILNKDFAHVPILQENRLELAQTRGAMNNALLIEWQNNQLTWNEWRVALDKDPVAGMDLYYYQLPPEFKQTTTPTTNTLDNEEADNASAA